MKKSIKLSLTGLSFTSLAVGAGLTAQHLKNKSNPQKEKQNIQTDKRGINKPISEWLKINGNKTIISDTDISKANVLNKKWENFKAWYDKNSNNPNWKINGWTTKKNDVYGYNEFKDLCQKNSKKETDNQDELVKEVIMHCVEDSN